jgi:hypothetical protein
VGPGRYFGSTEASGEHYYFFGAHDVNRMQFIQGRDLKLVPAEDGPPLNYFVYPYVEIGGKEYPNVSIAFSFEDTNAALAGAD